MKAMYRFYNEDCVEGCKKRLADGSADLIITDPPYGIEGHTLHKHYHRKEEFVLDGYIEIPREEYAEFSRRWVEQATKPPDCRIGFLGLALPQPHLDLVECDPPQP